MAILDDFVRFIDFQLTADSQVEVDFYEICLLCASVDEFFDNFMAGIELVENGQKGIVNPTWEQEPIAFGIGFACTEEFEACLSYQEALKKRKAFLEPS